MHFHPFAVIPIPMHLLLLQVRCVTVQCLRQCANHVNNEGTEKEELGTKGDMQQRQED